MQIFNINSIQSDWTAFWKRPTPLTASIENLKSTLHVNIHIIKLMGDVKSRCIRELIARFSFQIHKKVHFWIFLIKIHSTKWKTPKKWKNLHLFEYYFGLLTAGGLRWRKFPSRNSFISIFFRFQLNFINLKFKFRFSFCLFCGKHVWKGFLRFKKGKFDDFRECGKGFPLNKKKIFNSKVFECEKLLLTENSWYELVRQFLVQICFALLLTAVCTD